MFDFLRDRPNAEDRVQETLDAYLDNSLTPADRAQFEARLAADARLRAEVDQLRALRLQLRAMPRRRVPRSFALNPELYGRPKAQPLMQLYPVLRGATAVSAFLLVFVLALGLFRGQFAPVGVEAPTVAEIAMDESAAATIELFAAEEAQLAAPEEAAREEEAPAAAAEMAAAPTEAVAALPPDATTVPDLSLEAAPITEATLPPNAGGALESAAPAPIEAAATEEAIIATQQAVAEAPAEGEMADTAATEIEAPAPAPAPAASLLPWQLGLGILFLVLLALWLLARRSARL